MCGCESRIRSKTYTCCRNTENMVYLKYLYVMYCWSSTNVYVIGCEPYSDGHDPDAAERHECRRRFAAVCTHPHSCRDCHSVDVRSPKAEKVQSASSLHYRSHSPHDSCLVLTFLFSSLFRSLHFNFIVNTCRTNVVAARIASESDAYDCASGTTCRRIAWRRLPARCAVHSLCAFA